MTKQRFFWADVRYSTVHIYVHTINIQGGCVGIAVEGRCDDSNDDDGGDGGWWMMVVVVDGGGWW